MAKIDSVFDFTDKGLVELKSWLEPWFRTREGCECVPPAPSGDTIDAIIGGFDPAGFWKLNESSGTVAADSSGNGQDLATDHSQLPPIWGQTAGPPGQQSANFDVGSGTAGTAGRVSRNWAQITGSFTAGIWINLTTTNHSYVMGQSTGGSNGWQLYVTGSTSSPANRPTANMGSNVTLNAINALAVGTWAFIAMSYDSAATQFKLYVDGLLQATSATFTFVPAATDPYGGTPLYIGHIGLNDVVQPHFVGSYAFFIPSALTGAEVLSIYNSAVLPAGANAGKALIATGLGGTYWDFASAGSGTTAARPTLTANGSALFVGTGYYDTTIGKPIWWNGTVWKDATGTTV